MRKNVSFLYEITKNHIFFLYEKQSTYEMYPEFKINWSRVKKKNAHQYVL